MVLVQLIYGGSNILIKFSLAEVLNPIVFMGHLLMYLKDKLLILASLHISRKQRPSLSFSVAAKIFVLALFGITIHLNVYYAGLAYTSPIVACALSNVIPSLTFLMAVLFGLEKLKIRTARGQAKVADILFGIGGSLVFTFWKGGYLFKGFVKRPLINISVGEMGHVKEIWIKGALLILTSHIAWSAWLILQAVVSEVYTARLSLTTMICFFASLQSSFLALFFTRNPISWRLEWNLQLLTIVYCVSFLFLISYY
ncbi:PREDICTED: WAT1-related [Prunus dulcis]|uniref:WAT1-related protein n=1 Tax=Prunus dulcis TaxID=3755 RepID=A0A5E4FMI7_PRUDU|nr:PREDICTED: WAT1-related [Prunus dulcis]